MSQVRWIELSGPLDASSIDAPQVLEAKVPWLTLRDVHPMGSVLRAFDGAVAATGYNTVQETQVAALPTLLWPFARDVDDQFARANLLARQHRALVFDPPAEDWSEDDAARLAQQMAQVFEADEASRLRASMLAAQASHGGVNGTDAGARAIVELFSSR